MCPFCDRKIGKRKDGSRKKHYIDQAPFWSLGHKLSECKDSSRDGAEPTHHTKTVADRRRNGKMTCLACRQWVKVIQAFRPVKHDDLHGKVCAGWRDNPARNDPDHSRWVSALSSPLPHARMKRGRAHSDTAPPEISFSFHPARIIGPGQALVGVTTRRSRSGSTSTVTVSPSVSSPDSITLASGSPIDDCTRRRSGRAP